MNVNWIDQVCFLNQCTESVLALGSVVCCGFDDRCFCCSNVVWRKTVIKTKHTFTQLCTLHHHFRSMSISHKLLTWRWSFFDRSSDAVRNKKCKKKICSKLIRQYMIYVIMTTSIWHLKQDNFIAQLPNDSFWK